MAQLVDVGREVDLDVVSIYHVSEECQNDSIKGAVSITDS